jgi:DNA polymerase I-like protein with 3'-5' exonuclease and polymerase domains
VGTYIYASVTNLKATIETGAIDAHLLTAGALFERPLTEVTKAERRWGKYLNMAAVLGLSLQGLADLAQVPLDKAAEMRERYRRQVLA